MDDSRPPVGHFADGLLDIDFAVLGHWTTNGPVHKSPDGGPGVVTSRHLGADTELALVECELLASGDLGPPRVLERNKANH